MRRLQFWLVVGIAEMLALEGVACQYLAFHRPIRVGMSEREVDDVMGISWGFPWSHYTKDTWPGGVRRGYYELTDIFGNQRGASVAIAAGRVRVFTAWDQPFSQSPPWLEWLWPQHVVTGSERARGGDW